jgi:prepilin-type N-terminal cleavage/methylation domain-containing protein
MMKLTKSARLGKSEIFVLPFFRLLKKHAIAKESGFTLVEIIVAIVIIGVTVPAIMIPFSGLSDTKNPEYVIQASFVAQKKMEELANQYRNTITTACPEGVAATSTDGDYSLDCQSEQVGATDPDTTLTSTFARKTTLTVSRTDGAMASQEFYSLFALND